MSDRYAGLPITDDDAAIAAALEDVSVPTLLVSLVHLTGDASIDDDADRCSTPLPNDGPPIYLPTNVGFGGFDPKNLQISARGQVFRRYVRHDRHRPVCHDHCAHRGPGDRTAAPKSVVTMACPPGRSPRCGEARSLHSLSAPPFPHAKPDAGLDVRGCSSG